MTAKTTDFPSKTALVDLVEHIKTDLNFDASIASRIRARLSANGELPRGAADDKDLLHQVKGTIDPALSNLLADFAIEHGKLGKRHT